MKPHFFINCCQKQEIVTERKPQSRPNSHTRVCGGHFINVIEDYTDSELKIPERPEDESFITTTAYFTFLSESVRGNKIIIRVYDEGGREIPDIYFYQFEKSDRPERIVIPLYLPKKSIKKYTYSYKVCNTSLTEIYFEGKFVVVSPKYKGHMTVGFIGLSKKNASIICKYGPQGVSKENTYANYWQKVWSWRETFNFDILVLGGNFSFINTLFQIYKHRGGVSEIFELFRRFVLQFFGDESVSRVLRHNWNINFFNEMDICVGDDPLNSGVVNEFLYYTRIMYENYFIYVHRAHGNSLQYRQVCGTLNMIFVDAVSTHAADGVYYAEKNINHVQRSLHPDKLNIVILNRPLRYLSHRERSAERMLKALSILSKDFKLKIVSFHKNGISYMQTHYCGEAALDEAVVSGMLHSAGGESLIKKKKVRLGICWRKKKDGWSVSRDQKRIITRSHRNFNFHGGGCILVNNFLLNGGSC
jgi:hypothetical protein